MTSRECTPYRTKASQPASGEAGLITKKELATALRISLRTVDNMMKGKKIPFVRITSRCVRFRLASVMAALSRYEVNPVGMKANSSQAWQSCLPKV